MELCTICHKQIETFNMQSHVLGKKHLKQAEFQDRNNRSIVVNIPQYTSLHELYCFFSQYGTIKSHKAVSDWKAVFEFTDKRVAEDLTAYPICMKHKKLRIVRIHQKCIERDRKQEEDEDGPMKKLKDKANVQYSGVISFDKIWSIFTENTSFDSQLSAFLNVVRITDQELSSRYIQACRDLNNAFSVIFPKCKAYQFGSTNMSLGFKECDLDVFLDIGEPVCDSNESPGWTTSKIFSKLKSIVYKQPHVFSEVAWIQKARVPLVKFRFLPTKVSCDFSFKNSLGVHKTDLIRYCLSLDERLTPLMILIKYWARHFKITRLGGLRNYALILLVIFFLQQPSVNLVPSIIALQEPCTPKFVDGWQVNFSTTVAKQSERNTSTIPELLHDFFSFYSTFDLQSKVICTLHGVAHPRTVFTEQCNLLECVSRYREYMAVNPGAPTLLANNIGMCIQDPIELNHNICASSTADVSQNFITFCAVGAEVCASAAKQNSTSLLPNLFVTLPTRTLAVGQIALQLIVGQFKMDPNVCCTLACQCIESVLKDVFKLQLEILIHGKTVKQRVLRCMIKSSDTDTSTDDIIQSSEKNEEHTKNENFQDKCSKNNVDLEFTCTFNMHAMPAGFAVVFTNQQRSHVAFTKFINFINLKLPPIVYRRFSESVERQQ